MDDFGPVLLDTDAWSQLVAARKLSSPRVTGWRRALEGRPLSISAQTRAEVLFGARKAGWGPARVEAMKASLDGIHIAYPTAETVDAWAFLRAECIRVGHPLQQKIHMGDAWVAATAISLDVPLLAADAVYDHAPGLRLLNPED